jgi:hypothetical protein
VVEDQMRAGAIEGAGESILRRRGTAQPAAGDGIQRPLLRRARFQPRLSRSVGHPMRSICKLLGVRWKTRAGSFAEHSEKSSHSTKSGSGGSNTLRNISATLDYRRNLGSSRFLTCSKAVLSPKRWPHRLGERKPVINSELLSYFTILMFSSGEMRSYMVNPLLIFSYWQRIT